MKSFLFTFFCIFSTTLVSQVSITPESLEKTIESNITEYVYDLYITNESNSNVDFWWKIFREENTPREWDLFVCDFQLCYSSSVIACPPSRPNKMPADTTLKITFHIKSNEYLGSSRVWLELYSDKTYQTLLDRTDTLGVITISLPTSLEEDSKSIKVYPNPVTDKLIIDLDNLNNYELKIYSSLGILKLKEQNLTSTGINVSNLENGVYFLVLEDKHLNKIVTHKFIKIN